MFGPGNGLEKDHIRTTEGDEISYEEATNCRLRDETDASMIFAMNKNSNAAPVNVNQINVNVKGGGSSSGKKEYRKKTPVKQVAPFD